MSDHIPTEIQFKIIKRVIDIRSLVRFRSVSKPWLSFIDSPGFIARARKTQPRTLLLSYKDDSNVAKYLCVNNDTFEVHQDLAPNVSAFMNQFNDLSVIGFSRGLLCLNAADYEGVLVLCNLSIRRSVGILVPEGFRVFGFVVCPRTNEPTIVTISLDWNVQIFTLSSKKWTTGIDCVKPRESIILDEGSQVVIGSCIYRPAYEKTSLQGGRFTYRHMIVSFDVIAKEFTVIDLPLSVTIVRSTYECSMISKLKGSLVVLRHYPAFGYSTVWKMKPDCSFTELCRIKYDALVNNLVGSNKNGELVVETTRAVYRQDLRAGVRALEAYDPCSERHTNKIWLCGQVGSFFISSYKETLHLLDHSDSCVYPQVN